MNWTITPSTKLRGAYAPPGDKSISHRAALFGGLASGVTHIQGFLEALDCLGTLEALRRLGADIKRTGEGCYEITGGTLSEPGDVIDVGNSGTTFRLLAGILAGQPFYSTLTGDDSIRKRPMMRVVAPLRRMGAQIDGRQNGALPPLSIRGGSLQGISYDSPTASAQVKSCLLLAGLFAEGETSVSEPSLSRDHTERMLKGFGVEIKQDGLKTSITGGQMLNACDIAVPADISSAAFFIVAALLVPDSDITLLNVGVNPTRTGCIDALKQAGADITLSNRRESGGEPVADIRVKSSGLRGMQIGGELMPRLIDEIPILCVAAATASGKTVVTNAEELRVKESDRIKATADMLRGFGAEVQETPDGLIIEGNCRLKGATADSGGDHRIAMASAVAGLAAEGETTVLNADCVQTSFPDFYSAITRLSGARQ